MSLRTKYILFLSLVIIATCSSLSWYFVRNKTEAMQGNLFELGAILVQNFAYNSRYAVYTGDRIRLNELIEGVMGVEDVVYVVVSDADGAVLAASSKGHLIDAEQLARDDSRPVYPPRDIAHAFLDSSSAEVLRTRLNINAQRARLSQSMDDEVGTQPETSFEPETIYDFGMPVFRQVSEQGPLPGLPLELQEQETTSHAHVYGTIQIGLTRAKMDRALTTVVRNFALLTILIIGIGILATIYLAGKISTPLQSLTAVARRVAGGDLSATVTSSTRDEVGHLAQSFDEMMKALQSRDHAISEQLDTITRQVEQLHALNQAAVTITSTLDLEKLLSTMLDILKNNLRFTHVRIVLYDSDRGMIYDSRMVGVPEHIERAWRQQHIPVEADESYLADVLVRGKPLLIRDIDAIADRMHAFNLLPAREIGITSFVCAPLRSTDRVLGYIATDRGTQECSQEDLHLLVTVASHMAVAIDNAQTYQQLEQFSHTLEQRVRDRTAELQTAYERLQNQTDQLQEANNRLRELDRLKSAFVSVVSHELRTPMTSIKGYVENLLDGLGGSLTDKQAYYLTRVKHNTERLTRMINDLLDLSKIEAGVIELNPEPLSIRELTADILEEFHVVARERSLTLDQHHPPELPVVHADRDKLHRILTNLIQNALKFTERGGRILIQTEVVSDTSLQISVTDTGCGISPEDRERVFDRFSQITSGPHDSRGAQLGLAITKGLVELHGGTIWVESTPGQGSCFSFTLPLQSPEA